jgi:hypothetical protein
VQSTTAQVVVIVVLLAACGVLLVLADRLQHGHPRRRRG